MKYKVEIAKDAEWVPTAAWYYRNFAPHTGESVLDVKTKMKAVHEGSSFLELIIDDKSVIEEQEMVPGLILTKL